MLVFPGDVFILLRFFGTKSLNAKITAGKFGFLLGKNNAKTIVILKITYTNYVKYKTKKINKKIFKKIIHSVGF